MALLRVTLLSIPYLVDHLFQMLNFIGIVLALIGLQYVRVAQEEAKKAASDARKVAEDVKKIVADRAPQIERFKQQLDQLTDPKGLHDQP